VSECLHDVDVASGDDYVDEPSLHNDKGVPNRVG